MVSRFAQNEQNMNAVEWVRITPNDPTSTWPTKGSVMLSWHIARGYHSYWKMSALKSNQERKCVEIKYSRLNIFINVSIRLELWGELPVGQAKVLFCKRYFGVFTSFFSWPLINSFFFLISLAWSRLKMERLRLTVITFSRLGWTFYVEAWLLYPKTAHCSLVPYVTICKSLCLPVFNITFKWISIEIHNDYAQMPNWYHLFNVTMFLATSKRWTPWLTCWSKIQFGFHC